MWSVFILVTSVICMAQERVGEKELYKLDGRNSRTSSEIKSGELAASVESHRPDRKTYKIRLGYKLKVELLGTQRGQSHADVPESYFSPEFLEVLRRDGVYQGENFRARHLGNEDVMVGGRIFSQLDVVAFDRIQKSHGFVPAFTEILSGGDPQKALEVKDLEIRARIHSEVGVLGAVTLDVKGKLEGIKIKAGFDLRL